MAGGGGGFTDNTSGVGGIGTPASEVNGGGLAMPPGSVNIFDNSIVPGATPAQMYQYQPPVQQQIYQPMGQSQPTFGGLTSLQPQAFGGGRQATTYQSVPYYGLGGMPRYAVGGGVQPGFGNDMFPQAGVQSPMYSEATQAPMERAVLRSGYGPMTDPSTGDQKFAGGGLASLGGRAIRGPGDGMSDDIPAHIGGVEPAALADGEYVLPADVVSHLGNGSTEAGTRKLDGMMARIRKARTGNSKQGKQINADKLLLA